ncbi:MAG: diaminopimelate epimerase [Fibrobacter sp.]|nr:diaminopimelate epimerase [Fibrobacter sp.]
MKFSKWTGLGNDFILPEPGEDFDLGDGTAERVMRLCDRRFGIGGDGVVLVRPLGGLDFEMRIFNADGSEAAMCGNATRCVAKFIHDRGLDKVAGMEPPSYEYNLHTLSGIVRPKLLEGGLVRVDMGLPREFLGNVALEACGNKFDAVTVSMGNPHAVIFVDDIENVPLEKWGPVLEHDAQFPDRCNIEFAEVRAPGEIRMRVWERGCGITLACGTGSCATLVAAQKTGRIGKEADIVLDGGVLHDSHVDGESVFMTGPAQEVFRGCIPSP